MATSFANLKKRRTTDLEKLQSEIEKINNPKQILVEMMTASGKRNSTNPAVDTLSFDSFQQ